MNYKKILLVGFISLFVAVLTSVLGVAGTVIGSVVSSMLYNMFVEAFEEPVSTASFSTNFEWEAAYIFPLAVIAIIQLLLIFAMLSEWGILPNTFLSAYIALQNLANNNLYRLMGIAMLVISVYPLVLKPDIIKKSHGAIIAFVGLIFLARGFVDLGNFITNIYDVVFVYFDFPIAVVAFVLILFVIIRILMSAREHEKEFRLFKHEANKANFPQDRTKRGHHSKNHGDFDYEQKIRSIHVKNNQKVNPDEGSHAKAKKPVNKPRHEETVQFKEHVEREPSRGGINESSDKIHFESNDLLDDYK